MLQSLMINLCNLHVILFFKSDLISFAGRSAVLFIVLKRKNSEIYFLHMMNKLLCFPLNCKISKSSGKREQRAWQRPA